MENFVYYGFILLLVVVGFFVVKKVAGCIIRTVVTLAVLGALAAIYYFYLR